MKKLLSIVLAIALVVCIAPIGTMTASAEVFYTDELRVSKTGLYNIVPYNYEYDAYGLDVLDKNGDELVPVTKRVPNGYRLFYPLIANLEYKIEFKGEPNTAFEVTKAADTIFPDTSASGWYNDAVTYVVGAGIMSGYSNGKFGTTDSIQRQDFLVMLARLDGVNLNNYKYRSRFPDVAAGSYYEAAVNWGAQNGIVTGYDNGKFGVGDKVTREQLVTFLYRYAKYKNYDTDYSSYAINRISNQYKDFKNVSSFAKEPILWAIDKGVISGKTNTTIVPHGKAQRCEVAKIMYNIYLNDIFVVSLENTTVKFAATINPRDDGTQYVIDSFEAKYKMDVEIVLCTMDGYIAEMNALIAAGMSPDVGRSNGDFPACVSYFDSLDKAKIDFNDPIWNQNTFKLSTFNGMPYMCDTWGNYWTEFDICIYSKNLLARAGCPTPAELDAHGKWTWDSFMQIAERCTQLSGTPAGCIHSNELAFNMAGGSVFKIQNERMVSGIDAYTTARFKKFAEVWKKGILNNNGVYGIANGTTAIATGNMWSLKKDGSLMSANWSDIGFYYLPAYVEGGQRPVTGIFRGYGIMRGAENPVGGGLFLRHYLDVNNYDVQNAFISEEAKNFFFRLTTQELDDYNPYLTYVGLNEDIAGINYNQDIYSVMKMDPATIESQMPSVKAAAEKGASNLNKYINQYIN